MTPRRILVPLLVLGAAGAGPAAAAPGTGTVTGVVTVVADGKPRADRSGVVVYLEGVPGEAPARPATKHAVRQQKLSFTPPVSTVVKGSAVEFPNDDKVFHNVFSLSKGNRFDLGLYKHGTSKSVTFKKAGVVDIYCNIHPQMVAKVLVVDSGFFAETDAAGAFRIDGVPPGRYPVVAWIAHGQERRGEVVVGAGKTATVTLEVVAGKPPARHLRKDGTPYGRYK